MLLPAYNPPHNELLDAGFDLQYITRDDDPFPGTECHIFFESRHVELKVTWPLPGIVSPFGSGELSIIVLRSRSARWDNYEVEGPVTILDPGSRLLDISLSEDESDDERFVTLRITHGPDLEHARIDEHTLARARRPSITVH